MNFKLDKIDRFYPKHQGLTFLALNPKSLCKTYMNNSYTLSFLIRIIYLFNMILTIKDETIQQYFKSGLSYNETLLVLSAHHNVSLSIHQLKGILKNWVYCEERQKNSINDVLPFVLNELESSSRCLEYKAMDQKLLMNCFNIDHGNVRLILKELDPLSVEQRARHSLTRYTYIYIKIQANLPYR